MQHDLEQNQRDETQHTPGSLVFTIAVSAITFLICFAIAYSGYQQLQP